jgi:hypothetical protein
VGEGGGGLVASEPAHLPAQGAQVGLEDIRRVFTLFSDLRRSTQFLLEHNSAFMFNELADEAEGGAEGEETGGVGAAPAAGAGAGGAGAGGAGVMDET